MATGADDDRLHGGNQPALSIMVCDALGHRQRHRRDVPHAMPRVPAVPHGWRPVPRRHSDRQRTGVDCLDSEVAGSGTAVETPAPVGPALWRANTWDL